MKTAFKTFFICAVYEFVMVAGLVYCFGGVR